MHRISYLSILTILITGILSIATLPVINKTRKIGVSQYLCMWNKAEKRFLAKSGRDCIYSSEAIPVIETENLSSLGKLAALSFLHWIKDNPEGVIALPTGKTPEFFIEYLKFYKEHWQDANVRKDLHHHGIHLKKFPETKNLKLVQMNEFYPIEKTHSFETHIKRFYIDLLEIPEENILFMNIADRGTLKEWGPKYVFPHGLVDLTLTTREPMNDKERLQKHALLEAENFCEQFEKKIRNWGGIGFCLVGIGPDGNIAFNMPGNQANSKTRLVKLNYPLSAAAAKDLGGIEYARGKAAMTIGLETITFNNRATIIILAAGAGKAKVVADAILHKSKSQTPSRVFHDLANVRFYLTKATAAKLDARNLEDIQKKRFHELSTDVIDDVIIEVALLEGRRIIDLLRSDIMHYPKGSLLIRKFRGNTRDLVNGVRARLIAKIEKGLVPPKNTTFLHTAPHHDDVMLSYHPLMRRMLKNCHHYFAYLTSGFNSVTNSYILNTLDRIPEENLFAYAPEIFRFKESQELNWDYAHLLRRYINAAECTDEEQMEKVECLILLKKICCLYQIKNASELKSRIQWLKYDYFPHQIPGEKDQKNLQLLKGAMRESEAERMLLMAGVPLSKIHHLRANFYSGDFFSPLPKEDDAASLLKLCKKVQPSIITVAIDPEGTGPDTHFKVMQLVARVVKMGNFPQSLKIWGYRNIWHRFSLSETNLMIAVSEKEMREMNEAFLTCFSTQKSASFPSPEYDGPFSHLAENIQRMQYNQLRTLLGQAFFKRHSHPDIRGAKGFVFIKEMHPDEFLQNAL